MGDHNTVKVKASITVPKSIDKEALDEIESMRDRAKAFGYSVETTSETPTPATTVQNWLTEHNSNLGYFVSVYNSSSDDIELIASGKDSQSCELANDITAFTDFLKTQNFELNGTFWREGGTVGELQRIVVKKNKIDANEEARLVFDD